MEFSFPIVCYNFGLSNISDSWRNRFALRSPFKGKKWELQERKCVENMRFIVTNITKDTSSRCGKLWQDRRRAVGYRNLLTQSRELFFAALFYMRKFSSMGGILNKTSAAGQQSVIWLSEDQNMELWRTELIYWGGLTIKAVIIGKLSWSYFMIQNIGGKCAQNFIIVQLEESLTNQLFKWVSDGL